MTKASFARLSPLAKGRIVGMREAGMKRAAIRKKVKKKDGKRPCLRAVDAVLKKFEEDPEWDGCEKRTAGGRPRDLTQQQEEEILDILLRDVGKKVVSATSVKRSLPHLRRVSVSVSVFVSVSLSVFASVLVCVRPAPCPGPCPCLCPCPCPSRYHVTVPL